MVNIILSPCLFLKNNEIKNLGELISVLEFANDYLDINWDMIDSSILCEDNWYSFPKYKTTIYNQFTMFVVPALRKLNKNPNHIVVSDVNIDSCHFNQYIVTDEDEFNAIVKYIFKIKKDFLFFLGETNKTAPMILEIDINNDDLYLPTIKDVWTEESANFNKYIKVNKVKSSDIFVNSRLCHKIDEEMKLEAAKINGLKGSLYKKYGEIVALRNNFILYHPKNPYDKKTDYYIRKDGKYIISVDLLHGHFEVFQGTGKQLWIHQYNYSGCVIPISNKISIDEIRNNHKVESI